MFAAMSLKISLAIAPLLFCVSVLSAQEDRYSGHLKFQQLEEDLPTPNRYRSASGAPGPDYYQQQADYVMEITLDDEAQIIRGTEEITYTNNSPDALEYLWVQLDQNMRSD